jgi:hypothetical protein
MKFENNKHIVYYWWNDNLNIKPYQDLRSPVILSIATLRAFHKEVPITILDISEFERPSEDWFEFQQALNFNVLKIKTDMDTSSPRYWKLCSKVSEIYKNIEFLKEDDIVFIDSDIFFLKSIFPLDYENEMKEKFCCWPHNTGFFYFNKNLESNKKLLKKWEDTIFECLKNDQFYQELKREYYYKQDLLEDEICFLYLSNKSKNLNIQNLNFKKENYCFEYKLFKNEIDLISQIKMLHCLYEYNGHRRGILCLVIEELKQNIQKSLTNCLIKKIFKNEIIRPSYNLNAISQMDEGQFRCLLR